MVKKISFIIAMSLVLTGCSMFSKDEAPETVTEADIPSDLMPEGEMTDDFGNSTDMATDMLGDAADSLEVMANDAAGLMSDIGGSLMPEQTDIGTQPFNGAQQQQTSQVQNNYVRPPQNYMDVRLNYVLDARKLPVWKVADVNLTGNYNPQYTSSIAAQVVEHVSTTLSPKVQEVWQKCRTDGTISGKDLKDMMSAIIVDKRTLLIHTKAMDATNKEQYYEFGSHVAEGTNEGDNANATAIANETAESVGGKNCKVFKLSSLNGLTKQSDKDYFMCVLSTEQGLIKVNEETTITNIEGSNCYISDDMKFSLREIRDADRESLTIGFIADQIE